MPTFRTTDERTLAYSVDGDGPLVVLLPGGPGIDPQAFFAGTRLHGFRQVILNFRGTGGSDAPAGPDGYRIAGYLDDVEELRRHLGVDRLNLYGSSHGGSVALGYASAHPESVERMVVAAGPARMDAQFAADLEAARARFEGAAPDGAGRLAASDQAMVSLRGAGSERDRQEATRVMIDTYVAHPTAESTQFLDSLAHAFANQAAIGPMAAEMMGGLDLLANAESISAPTLVLAGELDVRVPAEHQRLVADAVPSGELVVFADAGHLLHLEDLEGWASAVTDFLQRR